MSEEFRHIVRIIGTDLDGSQSLEYGLAKIRGLNINMTRAIINVAKLESVKRIGNLTDSDIQRIEEILKDPVKYGVPEWLLDRRRDYSTGKSSHLIGADLALRNMSDIEFMRQNRSWKGLRHSYGLKVRGQRTKTSGRTGGVVGVKKKKLAPGAAPAAAAAAAAPAAQAAPAAPAAAPAKASEKK